MEPLDLSPEGVLATAIAQKRYAEEQIRLLEAQLVLAEHQIEQASLALREAKDREAKERASAVAKADDLATQAHRVLKGAGIEAPHGDRTD